MSWLSELTEKAENILNKIDQNAAAVLQMPTTTSAASSNNNLSITTGTLLRKNLSNSTQSLKANLSSPNRATMTAAQWKDAYNRTARSESGSVRGMSDSVESKDKLQWQLNNEMTSSRRSSVASSKAESVTIDVDDSSEMKQQQQQQQHNSLLHTSNTVPNFGSLENQELAAFKIALNEVTNERDELRFRLAALNSDLENDALKQNIDELETLVMRLTEERDRAQQNLLEAQSSSNNYVHSLSELETNLAKLQQEYMEVAQKLQMQIKETEQQRQELQDYRSKAQRALQMKDNLIAELKANGAAAENNASNNETNNTADARLLQMELEQLKQEKQHLLEEHKNVLQQLEDAQRDLNVLSKQHAQQLEVLRATEEALRKEVRLEYERATMAEQRVHFQEMETLRLSNQIAATSTRLQNKEQQLEKIRADLKNKREAGNESLQVHETRIKTLTQTLVDKQNEVETITAERNALRIQLEKTQEQLKRATSSEAIHINVPGNALLSNSTDDVKSQYPLLLKANPFDNRVARRVKRAYSSLDSAGIRLGAFLRRYPLMRIGVLMYVGLLHIWVVFVLVSSTPN